MQCSQERTHRIGLLNSIAVVVVQIMGTQNRSPNYCQQVEGRRCRNVLTVSQSRLALSSHGFQCTMALTCMNHLVWSLDQQFILHQINHGSCFIIVSRTGRPRPDGMEYQPMQPNGFASTQMNLESSCVEAKYSEWPRTCPVFAWARNSIDIRAYRTEMDSMNSADILSKCRMFYPKCHVMSCHIMPYSLIKRISSINIQDWIPPK